MRIANNDWKKKIIPDKYVAVLILMSILSIWLMPEINISGRLTGVFVISIPLLLLASIVPGSIGGGDIKLMAAGGFLLGAGNLWQAFVIGILIAGIYVIILLITKKADRKTEIALGPFLCLGIIWVLCGI